jgi:hypothetical protein
VLTTSREWIATDIPDLLVANVQVSGDINPSKGDDLEDLRLGDAGGDENIDRRIACGYGPVNCVI